MNIFSQNVNRTVFHDSIFHKKLLPQCFSTGCPQPQFFRYTIFCANTVAICRIGSALEIIVTGSEKAKTFADAFRSQFVPNLSDFDFADIIAKVEEEVVKKFLYPPIVSLRSIISGELQGYIRIKIW